jgi:hypothetical protein
LIATGPASWTAQANEPKSSTLIAMRYPLLQPVKALPELYERHF